MKILLLGKTGLLGAEFYKLLQEEKGVNLLAPSHQALDLLDFQKTRAYIAEATPDLIIHCVAYTGVDQAETDQEACHTINVELLQNILKTKVPIIHFSSDYVFGKESGVRSQESEELISGFSEDTPVAPLNYYGKTKAEAESLLQEYGNTWYNVRTSWLFGPARPNFVQKILEKAKEQSTIQVVSDQMGRPTSTRDLAKYVVNHFVNKFGESGVRSQESGHYHLQGSGKPVSWAELARYIIEKKNISCTVEPVSSDTYNAPAKRPLHSILQNTRLPEDLPDWKESLDKYLKEA